MARLILVPSAYSSGSTVGAEWIWVDRRTSMAYGVTSWEA